MSTAPAARDGLLRRALLCILAAALLIGAVAHLCTSLLGLGASYVPKALGVFAVGAALILPGLTELHPFRAFGAANQVTLIRGALVALLAALIGEGADAAIAALITAVAAVVAALDGVDGWLARRAQLASDFGARFDMETDALLIAVLAILAWQFGKAGEWVLASGLLRYGFVAAGMALPVLRGPLPPSRRRKVLAVVQMVALIVTVAPFVPVGASVPVAAMALGLLTFSFALDVLWLLQNGTRARAGTPAE